MYMIEKDLDLVNDSAEIIVNDIGLTIKLWCDNWGSIDDKILIDSVIFDFELREFDDTKKNEVFNILDSIKTFDDLIQNLETTLKDIKLYVNVIHDNVWSIYNDKIFEEEISKLFHTKLTFTEQGMQMDGDASLEN